MPILGSFGAGSAKGFGLTGKSAAPIDVDYLVVAGGGAGTYGGGGAGGYRTSFPGGTKLTLEAGTSIPITIGAGGVSASPQANPYAGSNSVFGHPSSPITSSGGGGPNSGPSPAGGPGGSGGGGAGIRTQPGETGNAGGYSPPGGGGGAGGAGGDAPNQPFGAAGVGGVGAGVPTDYAPASYGTPGPSPTVRYFAGGGGGNNVGSGAQGTGGYGGGGNGRRSGFGPPGCPNPGAAPILTATDGTVNTGGGSGGEDVSQNIMTGGSGVVLLNVPSANASGASFTVAPGTNTVVDNPDGSKTAVFTVSGTIQQG